MTTLEEIAFLRRAIRDRRIDPDHLRRAYVYRRSGKTERSIPRLLLKNELAPRALLEALCQDLAPELPQINAVLRTAEEPEDLLRQMAVDPESPVLNGKRLGLCIIDRCLGIGGEACVFKARHLAFDQDVALKVLLPNNRRKAAALERLRREAEICARLAHPGLAAIFDFDVSGVLPYVAFEFVPGETLHTRIERFGRLTAAEVVKIAEQVSGGLQAAHDKGLLHRDLKPSNIIVSDAGQARLIDFGFARDLTVPGHITATGFIVGTPYYTAPEYGQEAGIDGRADLYSLGVTMFYALTGRLPFESRSVVRLLAMHMHEPPPSVLKLVPNAPPLLAQTIERLLAKEPAGRFPSAAALIEALKQPAILQNTNPAPSERIRLAPPKTIESLIISSDGEALAPTMVEADLELPNYDYIPQGLLQVFVDDPLDIEGANSPLKLAYPGAPGGDDGLDRDDSPSPASGQVTRDPLPRASEQTTASGSVPVWGAPPARQSTPELPAPAKLAVSTSSANTSSAVRIPDEKLIKVFCAACEAPVKKARKVLGNIVCLECCERVDMQDLCTACFGAIDPDDKQTSVFRKRRYCVNCSRRVILACSHCEERFPVRYLSQGKAAEVEGKPYCRSCVSKVKAPTNPDANRAAGRAKVASARARSVSGRVRRRRRR